MIYLLQDCYKDNRGEYHDILKIGYSKDKFSENREKQYDTHNFGYKFLGEKEGSKELENYLHKIFKDYNLEREWFKYDQDVISKFWKVSENDISEFISQEDLNEFIRDYILRYLVPSVDILKNLYLDQILSEIKEKDPKYDHNKKIYREEIIGTFKFVSSKEYEYFNDLNFDSPEIIEDLKKCSLYPSIIVQNIEDNSNKNNIVQFYKLLRAKNVEIREEFTKEQEKRKEETKKLLEGFSKLSLEEQKAYIQKLRRDSELYVHDYVGISRNTGKPVYNL